MHLHKNRISFLPPWISGFELTKLTKLTLSDNDLQGTPFNDDHFGVGQRKLKHLDLSGNKIQGLASVSITASLQWVFASFSTRHLFKQKSNQ